MTFQFEMEKDGRKTWFGVTVYKNGELWIEMKRPGKEKIKIARIEPRHARIFIDEFKYFSNAEPIDWENDATIPAILKLNPYDLIRKQVRGGSEW